MDKVLYFGYLENNTVSVKPNLNYYNNFVPKQLLFFYDINARDCISGLSKHIHVQLKEDDEFDYCMSLYLLLGRIDIHKDDIYKKERNINYIKKFIELKGVHYIGNKLISLMEYIALGNKGIQESTVMLDGMYDKCYDYIYTKIYTLVIDSDIDLKDTIFENNVFKSSNFIQHHFHFSSFERTLRSEDKIKYPSNLYVPYVDYDFETLLKYNEELYLIIIDAILFVKYDNTLLDRYDNTFDLSVAHHSHTIWNYYIVYSMHILFSFLNKFYDSSKNKPLNKYITLEQVVNFINDCTYISIPALAIIDFMYNHSHYINKNVKFSGMAALGLLKNKEGSPQYLNTIMDISDLCLTLIFSKLQNMECCYVTYDKSILSLVNMYNIELAMNKLEYGGETITISSSQEHSILNNIKNIRLLENAIFSELDCMKYESYAVADSFEVFDFLTEFLILFEPLDSLCHINTFSRQARIKYSNVMTKDNTVSVWDAISSFNLKNKKGLCKKDEYKELCNNVKIDYLYSYTLAMAKQVSLLRDNLNQ